MSHELGGLIHEFAVNGVLYLLLHSRSQWTFSMLLLTTHQYVRVLYFLSFPYSIITFRTAPGFAWPSPLFSTWQCSCVSQRSYWGCQVEKLHGSFSCEPSCSLRFRGAPATPVLLTLLISELFIFPILNSDRFLLFCIIPADHKLGGDGKLLGAKAQCLFCHLEGYTFQFEDDPSRSNGINKSFRGTFTFTHPNFCRLLGNGFRRENPNPELTFPLHVTGDGLTGCLNLATGDPCTLHWL